MLNKKSLEHGRKEDLFNPAEELTISGFGAESGDSREVAILYVHCRLERVIADFSLLGESGDSEA